ncbi:hypothetical protein CI109_104059 [Kwoniella shandongensis]|uniref:Uncharacterized protein n=1 Tax=Kwoniella shandongensis TaxID=1734106 RepID=A0A5M6BXC6_9TREE|nr:uncharacterized protein CI109_004055 [Kwoniella shandongensis]KAA5527517.1 hypothetical protein CI109_004055 [Kwoniella shandongensis]
MSRQTISSLESQLSSTNHELELATFLNKGILQTNTEYKLRIAELESENLILRKAESRLAKTEDRLEVAQKRVEELEVDMEDLERERDEWEARYWSLRDRLGAVLADESDMKRSSEGGEVQPTNTHSTRSKPSIATSSKPTPVKAAAAVAALSSKSTPITRYTTNASTKATPKRKAAPPASRQSLPAQAQALPTKRSLSPVRPPIRAQSKKRRRVEDSPSDDEDVYVQQGYEDGDEYVEEEGVGFERGEGEESDPLGVDGYAPASSPPPPTSPPRTRIPPRPPTSSTRKSRISLTSSASKRRESRKPVVEVRVKAEPVSPGDVVSDSDDDPLAMM